MNKLPTSLKDRAESYITLNSSQKKKLLEELYCNRKMSWGKIAKLCKTYTNRVRRDGTKLEITSRTKSEAQSMALENADIHPRQGKTHSLESKIKISESVHSTWDDLSDAEKEKRREGAKERWDQRSEDDIKEFRRAASEGVRLAAKEGSALEKALCLGLINEGYKLEPHKKKWVQRANLEIDIFLTDLNVAIEVDGPTHYKVIWGEKQLLKNKQRDSEKNGLLLTGGCVIIRVKQTKKISQKYVRDTLTKVLDAVRGIENLRPVGDDRIINLEG